MLLTIRPVHLTDLRRIIAIEREAFAEEAFDAALFVSLYLQGRDTFLVALSEPDRKIVGYISAYRENDAGYVASVAVAQAARGQGIGRALMMAAIDRLIAKGIARLTLHVRADNVAAIGLYQSLGYTIRQHIPDFYPDRMDGLYMEKVVDFER